MTKSEEELKNDIFDLLNCYQIDASEVKSGTTYIDSTEASALTNQIVELVEAHTATVAAEAAREARIEELGSLIPNYDGVGTIGYQYADGSQVSVDTRLNQLAATLNNKGEVNVSKRVH